MTELGNKDLITSTNQLLSKKAAILYYSLYSNSKYIDLIIHAVNCRLTPNETNKAITELQKLNLIETKTSIRKKRNIIK